MIAAEGLAAVGRMIAAYRRSDGADQVAVDLPLDLSEYLSWRRRFDDWIAVLPISRDAAHRQGNRIKEGAALNNLGVALVEVRRFEEAVTACQDAAALFRETRDRHGEGNALNNLGLALREVRRFEEAVTACQDAAAIFQAAAEAGDTVAMVNLGNLLAELVDPPELDQARSWYQKAAEAGDTVAMVNLGNLLAELVDPPELDQARSWYQKAAEAGHTSAVYFDWCAVRGTGRCRWRVACLAQGDRGRSTG